MRLGGLIRGSLEAVSGVPTRHIVMVHKVFVLETVSGVTTRHIVKETGCPPFRSVITFWMT